MKFFAGTFEGQVVLNNVVLTKSLKICDKKTPEKFVFFNILERSLYYINREDKNMELIQKYNDTSDCIQSKLDCICGELQKLNSCNPLVLSTDATEGDIVRLVYEGMGNPAQVRPTSSNIYFEMATSAGGTGILTNTGFGVTADCFGNVYVTGFFSGTATFGTITLTAFGNQDIFLGKIDPATLTWTEVLQAGATGTDRGLSVATDCSGFVYVTGFFQGTATFGTITLTANSGTQQIFIAKADPNGTSGLTWVNAINAVTQVGDLSASITVDCSGNIYITGLFLYPITFGTFTLTTHGSQDIFVAKLDSNTFTWAGAIGAGGVSVDNGKSITTDSLGNVYVTGLYTGPATFGTFTLTGYGGQDIFVAKVSPSPLAWVDVITAGGSLNDQGTGINIDCSGNIYVTGSFQTTSTFGTFVLTSSGGTDIFVAKVNSTPLSWANVLQAGGSSNDVGLGITTDCLGNIYVTGFFTGPATFGSITLTGYGGQDVFVGKVNPTTFTWDNVLQAGGSTNDQGFSVSTDCSGNIYVTGFYNGPATFGTTILTSSGTQDIFVAKVRDDSVQPIYGILEASGSQGDARQIKFNTCLTDTTQTNLLPGYSYAISNGQISLLCKCSCCNPNSKFYGVACSSNTILIPQ